MPVVTGVLACGWARRREVQLWLSISNFARNSSMTHSKFGFASLELQRFWGVSKDDRDKLGATFGWRWCRRRPRAPKSGPASALTHIAAVLLNIACNSPTTLSNYEFTTSELQRFQTLLKFRPIELHANLLRSGHVAARGCLGSLVLYLCRI